LLAVAYLINLVSTSEVNMKSFVIGTAGLVLALSCSLSASTPSPGNTSTVESIPAVSLSPSSPQANSTLNSFGSTDSFPVVDKNEQDMMNSAMNDHGVNQYADHKSVESSGSPSDSSGVPMPRAGWISFFGLLVVIAARQFSHSRRRTARTAIG
jgi:hypothetical protein